MIVGAGALEGGADEATAIHRENLSRLAQLSPAEIKQEREQIVAQCDPKLIEYIKSLRTRRESGGKQVDGIVAHKVGGANVKDKKEGKGQETETGEMPGQCGIPMDISLNAESEGGQGSVKTSDPSSKMVGGTEPPSVTMEEELQCDEAELPIPPAEAKKWMHMDKVGFWTVSYLLG